MDSVRQLGQIDWFTTILGVIILIAAAVFVIDLVVKLVHYIKKPAGWVKRNDDDHERLKEMDDEMKRLHNENAENIARIAETQKSILRDITDLKGFFLDKAMDDYRTEILTLGNNLNNGSNISKEEFEHVLKISQKYEDLVESTGTKNHEVDLTMKVIKEAYTDRMAHGFTTRTDAYDISSRG